MQINCDIKIILKTYLYKISISTSSILIYTYILYVSSYFTIYIEYLALTNYGVGYIMIST